MDYEFHQATVADDGYAAALAAHRRAMCAAPIPGLGLALSGLWGEASIAIAVATAAVSASAAGLVGPTIGVGSFVLLWSVLLALTFGTRAGLSIRFARTVYARRLRTRAEALPLARQSRCYRCERSGSPLNSYGFCASCLAGMTESDGTDEMLLRYTRCVERGIARPIVRAAQFPCLVHDNGGTVNSNRRDYFWEHDMLVRAFPHGTVKPVLATDDPLGGPGVAWLQWRLSVDDDDDEHGRWGLLCTIRIRTVGGQVVETWPRYALTDPAPSQT